MDHPNWETIFYDLLATNTLPIHMDKAYMYIFDSLRPLFPNMKCANNTVMLSISNNTQNLWVLKNFIHRDLSYPKFTSYNVSLKCTSQECQNNPNKEDINFRLRLNNVPCIGFFSCIHNFDNNYFDSIMPCSVFSCHLNYN